MTGRLLCLDIGKSRIGVAVSDPLGITAQGVGIIENKGFDALVSEFERLQKTYSAVKLIIGYPLNLDGTEGASARTIRECAEELQKYIDIPVELFDERFSTKAAEWALNENKMNQKKKNKVIDMLAAQVILQGYLDAHTI